MIIDIDPKKTALVLIDLQKGVVSRDVAPHKSADVVSRSIALADQFRAAGGTMVLVNVGWYKDMKDKLHPPADVVDANTYPDDFAELVEDLRKPGDLLITKRQWGAFHGTELDLQLRRRGVETIILAGIATNIGVESTARDAWERGYALIFIEDACSTFSAEMQDFAFTKIFPRLGRIAKSGDVKIRA